MSSILFEVVPQPNKGERKGGSQSDQGVTPRSDHQGGPETRAVILPLKAAVSKSQYQIK